MDSPLILLVDDEQAFLEATSKRLGKRGLRVLTSTSGKEALKIVDEHRNLDVVVLDVKMPDLDGLETLKALKQDYPLIEVIMLTGHATVENAVEGMKLGAFDYLMKPCDLDELMGKVNEAADKKRNHLEKIREAAVKNALSSNVE